MPEKKKGFLSRFLPPTEYEPSAPSDAQVARWLSEDDGPSRRPGGFSPPPSRPSSPAPYTPADYPDRWAQDQDDRPESIGVEIVNIGSEGPFGQAGLRSGDVITAVNGRPTTTEEMLMRELGSLGPGQSAQLSVQRGGGEITATIVSPS